ncbi:hypothetical protein PsorP6_011209 [Peronosclerospora sorghi]|uniref:Uncharacterized protein n=1 Tax=Peronosclerospora sorghi TaxID=230839 RepID=A0ACC0VV08_9STRA|nr:hypothetical protein PsorP6_011209 [Peronosclerospora sorghi]
MVGPPLTLFELGNCALNEYTSPLGKPRTKSHAFRPHLETAHFSNQYAQVLLRRRVATDLVAFLEERGYAKITIKDLSRFEVNYVVVRTVDGRKSMLEAEDCGRYHYQELQWKLHDPYAWLLHMVEGGGLDR